LNFEFFKESYHFILKTLDLHISEVIQDKHFKKTKIATVVFHLEFCGKLNLNTKIHLKICNFPIKTNAQQLSSSQTIQNDPFHIV
jgi:hypothetical protein